MNRLSAALFQLDDRVLGLSRRREYLRTPDGWRRMAGRWWMNLAVAIILAVERAVIALSDGNTGVALQQLPFVGWFAYRAGRLKSEWERLEGTGYFEQHRPPGL
jgi:hypothetical protein